MTAKTNDLLATHDEVALLLPWYANGTLESAEHAAVREHLGACLVCRRDLQRLQRLAQFAANAPTIDLSGAGAKAHFFRTLPPRRRPWYQRVLSGWQPQAPSHPVLAFGAALLLLAAMPLVFHGEQNGDPVAFRTLASKTADSELQAAADLRLVFAADLPRERINTLALALDAEIVGGPSAMGVYNVRLKKQPTTVATIEAAVAAWRGQPEVVLAEPVQRP